MSATTTRQAEPDQACADAVELARAAAEESAGQGHIGAHVGIEVEGDRVVTHLFDSLSPGYVGWRWAVTVSRASRSKLVTVSESVLLPGPESLLAPAWVPWTERVRPGDLKAGDLMPASADDDRLVPAVAIAGDSGLLDWDDSDVWKLSPGLPVADGEAEVPARAGAEEARTRTTVAVRPARVLSAIGRDEAADRWHSGSGGPRSPLARSAPAPCITCGFMVRLGGPLGRVFGVCANEFAPDDGKVVSVDHGCGAHSDGELAVTMTGEVTPAVDELGYDTLSAGTPLPEDVLEAMEDHELL